MKTDNKTTNKTEYAEMVRSSIDSRILSEAANHTFEKRRSPASTWAAAACFTLIFAAAAILLIKPMTERGQASKVTAAPEATKTVQTTPDACFTPVPTPDISNMRIIYGRADCIAINDVQHKPGTVTLYGGLREMLADEQYNNCIFAVDIDIQDSYPYSYLYNDPSEESDGLYAEYQNDPAVVRYNELYEQFVQENADRYDEFLARYHPSLSSFYSGYPTRDVEDAVFSSAFRNHLTSTGQEQILYDYGKAERKYYSKLSQARNEAEVQRLKSLGLIVEEYKAYGHPLDSSLSSVYIEPECRVYSNMRLRCLLTRDQLLNFPASPEFAYIVTPALNPEETPATTEAPQTWYVAADEKEELVIDFFRCIDEERFDDLAKLIAPEERAGYEAIAALAEGSRVGVRNISSVIVKEMNPYELTDDMVFAKSLEKYVGIDGARSAYRVKLDMSVYDNTGAFADETGETEQIVLLVKNAEEWFVGFWCLINDDQSFISEAQVEHIINLLAEYHAAQFTRSAQLGELKLSDNVLSDLEERQRCIEEMEKRICVHSGKFMNASVSVERLHIAPYYQPKNGVFECFTVLYYERTTVDYGAGAPFSFGIDHIVTIAPDGTVLCDIFSEENSTGFSNHPFPNRGIIWTDAEIPASYYTSERYQYLAAAHALLAGEVPERTDFHYGDEQYVRFRFDGDALKAYVMVNTMITAPGSPHTDEGMDVTVAMIPREVGELAYQKLYEYWGKYVSFSEMECDLTQEFDGFVGENWFALVTPDDSMHDLQVHCIFCFNGSEWHEIIGNNGGVYIGGGDTPLPTTIFGACVLDEDTAIICYYTKWFFTDGSDDGKLYIYRTENGGESWSRLDIVLPDFYNDMSYYAPLTPIFDESGMHGVIILDSGITAYGSNAPFAWLESHDGGQSWNYRNTEITP